jgi:hypothetical protein
MSERAIPVICTITEHADLAAALKNAEIGRQTNYELFRDCQQKVERLRAALERVQNALECL